MNKQCENTNTFAMPRKRMTEKFSFQGDAKILSKPSEKEA